MNYEGKNLKVKSRNGPRKHQKVEKQGNDGLPHHNDAMHDWCTRQNSAMKGH